MTLIMGQMKHENLELFALEFGKIAKSDIVYTLASTNINQSAPNLVKIYVTIRSWMNSIIDLIRPELSELFAIFHLVYIVASTNINQLVPKLVKIYMTLRFWL